MGNTERGMALSNEFALTIEVRSLLTSRCDADYIFLVRCVDKGFVGRV